MSEPCQSRRLGRESVTNKRSGFGAAGLADGRVIWSIATPEGQISQVLPTVVGDLLLVGWSGPPPTGTGTPPVSAGPGGMIALSRENGGEVLRYPLEGPFYGGVAVQDKYVFVGTGYKGSTGQGSFYVLSVK